MDYYSRKYGRTPFKKRLQNTIQKSLGRIKNPDVPVITQREQDLIVIILVLLAAIYLGIIEHMDIQTAILDRDLITLFFYASLGFLLLLMYNFYQREKLATAKKYDERYPSSYQLPRNVSPLKTGFVALKDKLGTYLSPSAKKKTDKSPKIAGSAPRPGYFDPTQYKSIYNYPDIYSKTEELFLSGNKLKPQGTVSNPLGKPNSEELTARGGVFRGLVKGLTESAFLEKTVETKANPYVFGKDTSRHIFSPDKSQQNGASGVGSFTKFLSSKVQEVAHKGNESGKSGKMLNMQGSSFREQLMSRSGSRLMGSASSSGLQPAPNVNDKADEMYRNMGLEKRLLHWIEKIRRWFGSQYIPLLLREHYENLSRINEVLSQHGLVLDFTYNLPSILHRSDWTLQDQMEFDKIRGKNLQPISLSHLPEIDLSSVVQRSTNGTYQRTYQDQQVLVELIKERVSLERYFNIPRFGSEHRLYVIKRLGELLQGSDSLGTFKNDSGGNWDGAAWNPKLPTDSQILAGTLFRMLTNASFSASEGSSLSPSFADNSSSGVRNFTIEYPSAPPKGNPADAVFFYQSSAHLIEPHFDIISGDETWYCRNGKNNFFYAVALFLYHVKTKCDGKFGRMKYRDLLSLLD